MNFARRLEILEDALLQLGSEVGYKVILLKEGENYDKAFIRLGLEDWPADRVIGISFVKAISQ